MTEKTKRFRLISVLLIISVLIAAASFAVYSYYFKSANAASLRLTPAYVMCEVVEEYSEPYEEKTSIKIKNTGNTDEYLRFRVVSYWVNADGDIVGKPSVMPKIEYDDNYWIKDPDNDTYYYKLPVSSVAPDNLTAEFLKEGKTIELVTGHYDPTDEDVRQVVVFIPEAVQADPEEAVEAMWPFVKVEDASGEPVSEPTSEIENKLPWGKLEKNETSEPTSEPSSEPTT